MLANFYIGLVHQNKLNYVDKPSLTRYNAVKSGELIALKKTKGCAPI